MPDGTQPGERDRKGVDRRAGGNVTAFAPNFPDFSTMNGAG